MTGFELSYRGQAVDQFEAVLSEYTKSKYVLATNTGTAALHLALLACGIKPGDYVLCPTMTFTATAAAIVYCGAIPIFYDCDKNGLLNVNHIYKYYYDDGFSSRIKAIITVNFLGQNLDYKNIRYLANEYKLFWIEDAAPAIGTWEDGKHAGTHGDCGIISFNGNKLVTTGGGGCVLTNDPHIYGKAKHLSMTAKDQDKSQDGCYHDEIGFNYRMPGLNAMYGIEQMKNIEEIILERRHKFGVNNYNGWGVLVDRNVPESKRLWRPLHTLPPYKQYPTLEIENAMELYYTKNWIGG